ncbi:hypothetical protein Tco_1116928, partial [Tanacetum coccineum]
MTDKYCLRSEIKKLEAEMWNLKVKGTDVIGYNQRFQELALLCVRMFPEESDKIERYVGGLPDMIHGSVVVSKPKTIQEAIEMATELMDRKIRTFAERQTENKRKQDDNNNQAQQQPLKKPGVAIAYTAGPGERKEYARTLSLCNKCKFHHNGQCTIKCANCKKIGYYRSDCLELKNQNHRNQAEGTRARGLVHALGGGKADQDLNDIEDDITNVVTDALSKKERIKPLRVRALVMTIGLDLPKQILNAQTRAQKSENLKHKNVGAVRFGKQGKLNTRYVGPFQVLPKVGAIAYKLKLPQELSRVHNTFHVSNLKKCYADEPLAVLLDGHHIDDKLYFVEEPIEIMDREVKRLKQNRISIFKVQMIENKAKTVAGTRYCSSEVAVRGGRECQVAAAGQSEHDTCPKRVIRG